MSTNVAVRAEQLSKRFGQVHALNGVDLEVAEGTVLGLLGPNGAGKTTTVRILATILAPDGGRAEVAGYDVVANPAAVRAVIALTGQFAAIDPLLNGRENLVFFGRLARLPRKQAERRADDLLDRFELAEAAGRLARTYSGGMRRRLDLCASLMADPVVLFLDEPTTGLDPRSRLEVWAVVGELRARGTTIVLTTQYLEEADRLADHITLVDDGRVIAEGTPAQLKADVAASVLEITISDPALAAAARGELAALGGGEPTLEESTGRLSVPAPDGADSLTAALRRLDAAGIGVADIGLRQPSLDDVFLALTGHAATPTDAAAAGGAPAAAGRESA